MPKSSNSIWKWIGANFSSFITSTVFYEGCGSVYKESDEKYKDIFVFSTTSGLVIPEEHYGAYIGNKFQWLKDKVKSKNPARLSYFLDEIFENCKNNKVFIRYQWDSSAIKNILNDNLTDDKRKIDDPDYREATERILEKFLSIPNLLISNSKYPEKEKNLFFLDPRVWLTIVGPSSVVVSARSPHSRKIMHGIRVSSKKLELLVFGTITGTVSSLPSFIQGEPTVPTYGELIGGAIAGLLGRYYTYGKFNSLYQWISDLFDKNTIEIVKDYEPVANARIHAQKIIQNIIE